MDDEQALANGFLHDLDHPALGTVRVLSTPIAMDGGGFEPSPATPSFGSEVRTILAEVGFDESDVAGLLASGVTAEARHTAR